MALLLFFFFGAALAACPSPYSQIGDSCYRVVLTPKTRNDAALFCLADGATLPIIRSALQNQQLLNYKTQLNGFFLGLQCYSDTGCRWDDMTTYTSASYNNFIGGRPDTRLGNCVGFDETPPYSDYWANMDCSNTTLKFLCQIPFNGQVQKAGYCNQGSMLTTPVTLFSPNYPNTYPMASGCVWDLYSGTSDSRYRVQLNFTDFALSPDAAVQIYTSLPLTTPVATYTGTRSIFQYTSPSYRFYMTFISTAYYNPARGFKVDASRVYIG